MRLPPRLRPGSSIGLIAPSGPVPETEVKRIIALLEARGYKTALGEHILERCEGNNYLSAPDAHRAADLRNLWLSENTDAVFCLRGGYGALRLYSYLSEDLFTAPAKLFTGYSDITALHLAFHGQGNMTTLHSPNASSLLSLDETSAQCFWFMAEQAEPFGVLPAPPETLDTMAGGTAEGELAGGNLCLLAHACGSRFQPDFKGKIVLLEEVGEAIYRADRCLTQLLNAGALQEAAGFVIGHITGWRKHETDPPRNSPESLWRDLLKPLGKPILCSFPFGHEPNPLTLPLGAGARLDADARTLTLLTAAVS